VNWKKIVFWAIGVILTLIIVGGVTLVVLVHHSASFRQSILARVERSLQESSGARLQARDFSLNLSHLSLDLYNVVVHGSEADAERPLLTADHLQVGLTIDSVLQKKWHVRDIIIDRPVASLRVNKAGENNLPKSPQKSSSSNTSIFDLAIRKLVLDKGEIYYNDRKTPMDAELHDVKLNGGYDPGSSSYAGTLSYDRGVIKYGAYAPVPHDLNAKFNLSPQTFTLSKLDLALGESRIALEATVDNYSDQKKMTARAKYDAILLATEFKHILKNSSIPAGTVRLAGELNYKSDPGRTMLDTVNLSGELSSSRLEMRTPSVAADIRDLGAHYRLDQGNAEVSDLHAELLGGSIKGKLTIRDLTGASVGNLEASASGVSLDQLQTASKTSSLRQAHLTGRLNADARAHWAKTMDNLVAHADSTVQASAGQRPATPLNSVIHADYNNRTKELALTRSYIRTPQTAINLNGTISNHSQLHVTMQASNLHELELIVGNFRAPVNGQPAPPLGLYGTASMAVTISGSTANPQIQGEMMADNLRVKGSSWKVLRTNIQANPSMARLSNGDLEAIPQGRITFDVQTRLHKWAYTPSSPIQVSVNAKQMSIADLERLAGEAYPVSGTLTMDVSVHGSQLNPVGHGSIEIANAQVSDEKVQNLHLQFQGNGNAVNARLSLHMPAGSAQANLDYFPKNQGYQVKLDARNFRLEKLQTVKLRNMQVAGGVNLTATGSGTFKDPQLQAVLDVPQITVKKQNINGLKLQTTVKNHIANLELDSNVAQVYIKAAGTVGIQSPYVADVKLDTGRIEFQPLLAIYAPEQAHDITGQTELHLALRGPLADKRRVEAHLNIPQLAMTYKQQLQLGAAQPIRVDYQNNTAVLQPTAIRGTDTNIQMQASVPVSNPNAAIFVVNGNIDLRIAQLIEPTVQSSGQVQFDIDSRKFGGGDVNGHIRVVNANFQDEGSPLGLSDGNGEITMTRSRLDINKFQGSVGGGTVQLTGGLAYRPAVQFSLALAADHIRLRYPDGLRTLMQSKLSLTGTPQNSQVTGQVKVERVSFTPDFDLDNFIAQFSSNSSGGGAAPGSLMQSMKLNITVQSTSEVNLTSSTVSLQGAANLRVVGTADQPVVLGRANLTNGELFYGGNRYTVQNSTIDFLNPVETEPVLNVQAKTRIQQYDITIGIRGPMEQLETSYTSDPALPPADIINLVARGQTTEAAGQQPSQPLATGAESLLASQATGAATSRIAKFAGISQLQIDPGLGNNNGQNNGPQVAVQQRVTSNLFVTFTSDVTSTQRQGVQVDYKFNPRWSVTGIRDQNGGFGVDGKYHKDF